MLDCPTHYGMVVNPEGATLGRDAKLEAIQVCEKDLSQSKSCSQTPNNGPRCSVSQVGRNEVDLLWCNKCNIPASPGQYPLCNTAADCTCSKGYQSTCDTPPPPYSRCDHEGKNCLKECVCTPITPAADCTGDKDCQNGGDINATCDLGTGKCNCNNPKTPNPSEKAPWYSGKLCTEKIICTFDIDCIHQNLGKHCKNGQCI